MRLTLRRREWAATACALSAALIAVIYAADPPRHGEAVGSAAEQTGTRGASPTDLRRNRVKPAKPIWNGDSFRIKAAPTVGGGEGPLPPYRFSSASGPRGGWFQPHSDSDPAVHGVAMVDDPTGLTRSRSANSVRHVIKITADERRSYAGRYVRAELQGPPILGPGDDRWVIAEIYLPKDTPVLPASSSWWTLLSIYGPPFGSAGPNSIHLARDSTGTGNDLTWPMPSGAVIWRRPATPGVWHIIARRIRFSSDPAQGFSEIWYSRRDAAGKPTRPLTRQKLRAAGDRPTQRRYYRTLDPAINWDGYSRNHADLKNYHAAHLWPDRTLTSVFFARHRVYDGTTPVRAIDPYYTGLR